MKAVKYLGIFFLTVCCCTSCKETNESLEIIIQNETDSIIHVKLYPIITEAVTLYPGSDIGGGFMTTEFNLPAPNDPLYANNRNLFSTGNLKIKPYTLALQVFDSIYISTANAIIKFTHEKVTGYSENIFSENSTWEFEVKEWTAEMFISKQHRDYRYIFLILKDKVIIE